MPSLEVEPAEAAVLGAAPPLAQANVAERPALARAPSAKLLEAALV